MDCSSKMSIIAKEQIKFKYFVMNNCINENIFPKGKQKYRLPVQKKKYWRKTTKYFTLSLSKHFCLKLYKTLERY